MRVLLTLTVQLMFKLPNTRIMEVVPVVFYPTVAGKGLAIIRDCITLVLKNSSLT